MTQQQGTAEKPSLKLSPQPPVEDFVQKILGTKNMDEVEPFEVGEPEEGETVIGVTKDPRIFMALSLRAKFMKDVRAEVNASVTQARGFAKTLSLPELEKTLEEGSRINVLLKQKCTTLENVMWTLVYQEFYDKIPSDHSVGIRKDGKIVTFVSQSSIQILGGALLPGAMLEEFLGGGARSRV